MSQFMFSTDTTQAEMPKPVSGNSVAALEERVRAAEARADLAERHSLQLLEDLEEGFYKVCAFMKETYNKEADDEITGRWFTHVINDLKQPLLESINSRDVEPIVPMSTSMMGSIDDVGKKFSESDANWIDGLGFSASGFQSPRGQSLAPFGASGFGMSQSVAGNGLSMSTHQTGSSDRAPKLNTTRAAPSSKKGGQTTKKAKKKSKDYKKSHNFVCELCNKGFSGASGLWYHNKHVHNAVTQLRPRSKNNAAAKT